MAFVDQYCAEHRDMTSDQLLLWVGQFVGELAAQMAVKERNPGALAWNEITYIVEVARGRADKVLKVLLPQQGTLDLPPKGH